MASKLQEGIYYRKYPSIGNSFCFVSLRIESFHSLNELGLKVLQIWNQLINLKKGIIDDLDIDRKHRKTGNISILIGYGAKIFEINGALKRQPASFSKWNFKSPEPPINGKTIIDGSDLRYSESLVENHLLEDHLIFQFIAETDFFTNRAVVELWKELRQTDEKGPQIRISGLYSGFQREDQRNWLGFHDGVSNLKPQERPYVIVINPRILNREDMWLVNGTYTAFIKFDLDLEKWQRVERPDQEKIIGRDKLSGCPLIGIDRKGSPIKDRRCPIPGTSEVIDIGNEYFREHPPYQIRGGNKILENSHIGSTRPIDRLPIWDKKSLRIYRQGFESLTYSEKPPGFQAGLNFVSFQNTPERLFRSLTYQSTLQKIGNQPSLQTLADFTLVRSAGIFLVPPNLDDEPFPGASIFFSNKEIRRFPKSKIA